MLRDGFRETRPSISRFVTFSRMLETFFGGFIQEKMERDFKEMYTVFSGGDDFFILGPWNRTIDFARAVREDFSRFCAENPDLTFSSGTVLSRPHDPLSFCAEMVEERLNGSKRSEGKNRITLFNQPLTWEELDKVLMEARKFAGWLKSDTPIVSRKFVHKLRRYGEMAGKAGIFSKGGDVETKYLRFVPLLVYDIKRNLTREYQRDVQEWTLDLRPTTEKPQGGPNLPYLRTIMEYVLTSTRS
jgi:CRISPR-associated protein Csm1